MQLYLQNITIMHVIHYNYTCKTYIMHFLVQKNIKHFCDAVLLFSYIAPVLNLYLLQVSLHEINTLRSVYQSPQDCAFVFY